MKKNMLYNLSRRKNKILKLVAFGIKTEFKESGETGLIF